MTNVARERLWIVQRRVAVTSPMCGCLSAPFTSVPTRISHAAGLVGAAPGPPAEPHDHVPALAARRRVLVVRALRPHPAVDEDARLGVRETQRARRACRRTSGRSRAAVRRARRPRRRPARRGRSARPGRERAGRPWPRGRASAPGRVPGAVPSRLHTFFSERFQNSVSQIPRAAPALMFWPR